MLTQPLLMLSFKHFAFGMLMTLTAVFLILLVLVQRGRGGGLSGALGGMGGQSAFGTKAGDTFTKITIGASIFWILLCVFACLVLSPEGNQFGNSTGTDPAGMTLPADEGDGSQTPNAEPNGEGIPPEPSDTTPSNDNSNTTE